MGDYGFRISKSGDVKTGDDKDMVVTSKYALLKGSIAGTTSGNCAAGSGDPWGEGVITTFTIAHNLGYIPMFQAFVNYSADGYYRRIPVQLEPAFSSWAAADSTNLYIYCYNNVAEIKAVILKYFIFIDKGKL